MTPLLTITGVALWAAAILVGSVIRRRLVAGQPVDQDRLCRLGPFDVAFVIGGPERVKITVLASLVDEGVLRVVGNGFDLVDGGWPTEPTSATTLRARALDDVRAGRRAGWTTDFVLDDLSDDLRSLVDVPPAALALAGPLALRWLPLIGLCAFWLAIGPGLVLAVLMGLAILLLLGMVALDLGHEPMLETRRRVVATILQEAGRRWTWRPDPGSRRPVRIGRSAPGGPAGLPAADRLRQRLTVRQSTAVLALQTSRALWAIDHEANVDNAPRP